MTHPENDTQEVKESQETFEVMLREKLQQAVRTALITVLEAEVDAFIGAVRYERREQRRDYRNGHYCFCSHKWGSSSLGSSSHVILVAKSPRS
jgi:hypothetical protein